MKLVNSIKYYFLIAIIATSIAIPLSVFISQKAAATQESGMSVEQKIQSFAYYQALSECMQKGRLNLSINSNSAVQQWFKGGWGPDITVGFLIDGQDSVRKCGNMISGALSLWGYSDNTSFLKGMGYSLSSDGTTWDFPNKSSDAQNTAFTNLIKNAIYSGNTPKLDDISRYNMILSTYVNQHACNAKDSGLYSAASQALQRQADSNAKNGQNSYTAVSLLVGTNLEKHIFTVPVQSPGLPRYYAVYPDVNNTGVDYAEGQCDVQSTAAVGNMAIELSGIANRLYDQIVANAVSTATNALSSLKSEYTKGCSSRNNIPELSCSGMSSAWDNFISDCVKSNYAQINDTTAYTSGLASCMATKTGMNAKLFTVALSSADLSPSKIPDISTDKKATAGSSGSSCAITDVGWIVCPVLSFLSNISDRAYNYLTDNYLTVDTQTVSVDSGTYTAWTYMRNLANIAFVIVFLIVIFSQLTGQGITNYGVKKMLPRLIVAAILVNLSFFVGQIGVDLSNILGVSLKKLFELAGGQFDPLIVANGASDQTNNWVGIVAAVTAGAGIAWGLGLSVLLPFLIGALIAVLMTFVVLVIRQMLIILLVVVAPIAFVAYLMPNTEQWFTRWRKMFTGLLLVYPIIGLLFGAAALASKILLTVYGKSSSSGDGTNEIIGQIVAQGVVVLPLFLLPSLLKNSLSAVGSIGAKINNIGGKMQSGAKSQTSKAYGNSRLGQYEKYRQSEGAKRRSLIQSGAYSGRGGRLNPRNWMSGLNRGINESGLSGNFGDRSLATGTAIADKEDAELVANAATRLDNMTFKDASGHEVPLTQRQMMDIALGKDVVDGSGRLLKGAHTFDMTTRRAAMQKAARIATVKDAQELVDASSGMEKAERKTLSSALAGSSVLGKAPYLGGKTLGDIEQGTADSTQAALQAIRDGKINAEALAATDKTSAEKLLTAVQSTDQGSPERAALMQAYARLNDPSSRLREKIVPGSEHDSILQSMRSL